MWYIHYDFICTAIKNINLCATNKYIFSIKISVNYIYMQNFNYVFLEMFSKIQYNL